MELKDLNVLGIEVQNRYRKHFNHQDVKLPEEFKVALTSFNSDNKIEYLVYSLIVHSPSSLEIYIPNQWIIIAYYFVDFYLMLREYKVKVETICGGRVEKEEIKRCQDNEKEAINLLNTHNYHGSDRNLLVKFLSDYSWWKGGKSIDRVDYYVSPILQLAGLVNISQSYISDICRNLAEQEVAYNILDNYIKSGKLEQGTVPTLSTNLFDIDNLEYNNYLTAIRTKPFVLLAGISGTGKSRIVRELAFKSCPSYLQDKDNTSPGNYCMIEVKPNWHDSTELLGYYSNLNKAYQFKKFVKFLVKAKMYPDVPFFVCLDEMNLAPVEQYFAEILSVMETRKKVMNDEGILEIKSDIIIEPEHFKRLGSISDFPDFNRSFTDRDVYLKLHDIATENNIKKEVGSKTELITKGLSLPENVIIIGTVNMDDTTHKFSRKVIDRAMTIEMNGGKLKNMYSGCNNLAYLEEGEQKKWQVAFKQKYVNAEEVLKAHSDVANQLIDLLPSKLEEINVALKGTPFEVSYRVLNELTIMVGVMLDEDKEADLETIVSKAIDSILLMKILPRIEGDSEMFNLKNPVTVGNARCTNRLEWLRALAPTLTTNEDGDTNPKQTAKGKLDEMIERLNNQEFTRFWP